jgi:hypothetical protein
LRWHDEHPGPGGRGSCFFIFSEKSLPSVNLTGVVVVFFFEFFLPSVSLTHGKLFAECPTKSKELFAVKSLAKCPMPRVALGKAFAECI